jgi:nitroreductase
MRKPLLGPLDPFAVRIRTAGKRTVLSLLALPGFARIFYCIFSTRFSAEQRYVAAGIRAHLGAQDEGTLRYRLRRHVHRLEKGLSMRERRSVFGLDYIELLLRDFTALSKVGPNFGATEDGELQWYLDVLARYFAVCDSDHSVFLAAKRQFQTLHPAVVERQNTPCCPYASSQRVACAIGFEDFYALTQRRRSVRWFLPERVSREDLDKAVIAANQSPSACNRQSIRARIYDSPEDARRFGKLAPGAAGLHANFQALIVLTGDLSAYAHERDRHAIYVDGGIKAMALMLALESLQLSSCALNWPDDGHLDTIAAAEMGLPFHERIVLMIAIGKPDPKGLVPYSFKTNAA